jgi:hypothetical protein
MTPQLEQGIRKLYQEDYALWIEKTVQQLRHKEVENLDWEHLVEEIEDLGRELKHKVDSYLKQLLIHLLLYQYWTQEKERCGVGWRGEINNFRDELEWLFESKTLYNYFLGRIEVVYGKARKQTILKTQLPSALFPEQCPFSVEQILDSEFFPNPS